MKLSLYEFAGFTKRPFRWPCGRWQVFAAKFTLQANPAESTKPAKTSAFSAFSAVNNSCDSCPFVDGQSEIRSTNSYVRNYKPFLTNKANFEKSQVNVNRVLTRGYEQMDTWSGGKNEPKTNPIQTQYEPKSKKAKMNVTSILTVGYENISNWAICENKPNQGQNKPEQTQTVASLSNLFQRQKMLYWTINLWCLSLGYYPGRRLSARQIPGRRHGFLVNYEVKLDYYINDVYNNSFTSNT